MSVIRAKNKKITEERVRRGLSMRELSDLCGINYSTVSKIENKKQSPRPRIARLICDALEKKFDDLFEIIDKPEAI